MKQLASSLLILGFGLTLAACGEAPFKAPLPDRELAGAESGAHVYPTGNWSDDYGNVWAAQVTGAAVTAQGMCGPGLALVLRGEIDGRQLRYQIEGEDRVVVASGQADLVNGGHAFFDTRFPDGTPSAEGVLHFAHASPVRDSAGLPTACLASAPPNPGARPYIDPQQKPAPEQEAQP